MQRLLIAILGVTLCGGAQAHDHNNPAADAWFESLKVPSDGLALQRGGSCCNYRDCKERPMRTVAAGVYQMQSYTGEWLTFGDNAWITDPSVIESNPYFQAVGCI